MKRALSFRTMMLLAAAALLIPLGALMAWHTYGEAQRDLAAARKSSLNLARLAAAHYSQFLRDNESLLRELGQRPDIRAMDSTRCDTVLPEFHLLFPLVTTLVVMEPDGRMFCSSLPLPHGQPVSLHTQPWFGDMSEAPGLHVSEPMVGPISGLWTTAVSYPVLGNDGRVAGRIALGVYLERFQSVMDGLVLPEGAVLTLVSAEGALLARLPPLPEKIGARLSDVEIVMRADSDAEGVVDAYGIDGVLRVYGYTGVASSGWKVHAGIPHNKVLAAAYSEMRQIAAAYLMAAALLLLFMMLVYRWLNRSVDALRSATLAVERGAGGGLEEPHLAVSGPRELRDAVSAFNRLLGELRLSDERFRLIGRATNDAVWDWNLATNALWWNENFQTLFGYAPEQIEPGIESWFNRLHPDDAVRVKDGIYRVINAGGALWSDEYRFLRADGSYTEIFDRGFVMRDTDGKALRMIGGMQDISDRKRAEEDIRHVFNLSPDVIFVTDFAGRFLRISPAARKISGYTDEEIYRQTFLQLVHPDDLPAVIAELARVSKGGVMTAFMGRLRIKDGSYRWMECSAVARPEKKRFYAVARDITERRRIEAKLSAQTAALKHSNDELQRFSRIAAHDLQEPLRAVASYSQLIVRRYAGQDDPQAEEYVEHITAAVHRLRDLIEVLRLYMEVSSDTTEQLAPTDLNVVLEKVLAELKDPIEEAGATVSRDPLPVLQVSPQLLRRVFHQLIGNALKFHDVRPLQIRICAQLQNAEWTFTVFDNGIGIEPQHAERIFEIFPGLHQHGRYDGRGIGLAVCRKIIEQHGGRIWVEPGDPGAVFRFTLPAG